MWKKALVVTGAVLIVWTIGLLLILTSRIPEPDTIEGTAHGLPVVHQQEVLTE